MLAQDLRRASGLVVFGHENSAVFCCSSGRDLLFDVFSGKNDLVPLVLAFEQADLLLRGSASSDKLVLGYGTLKKPVCSIENRLSGTIIIHQGYLMSLAEQRAEIRELLQARASEAVDQLAIVPDHKDVRMLRVGPYGLKEGILHAARVLMLVYEHVQVVFADGRTDVFTFGREAHGICQHVVVVHERAGFLGLLVYLVKAHDFAGALEARDLGLCLLFELALCRSAAGDVVLVVRNGLDVALDFCQEI